MSGISKVTSGRLTAIFVAVISVNACSDNSVPASVERNYESDLTNLNPQFLVTEDEAYAWSKAKHDNMPALTGSPEWHAWMADLEQRFESYGVIDVSHNSWEFERWATSDDATDWSLTSDGDPVKVAFYGAYSGSTGPEGVTAELVYYDHNDPPVSIKGKIVVISPRPHPERPYPDDYRDYYTYVDYEYRSETETYPPLFEYVDPSVSYTFDIYYQLAQELHQIAIAGGAVGLVIAYDMSFARTVGLYAFPVPDHYQVPTLTLDRLEGARVAEDARAGKTATLRLEAKTSTDEVFQLVGYLPGRDYGTDRDEQILMVTHTDGPSITQDNGALGILAAVKYFSNIPQENRPRTLALYLDCRHYIPGMEPAFPEVTWFRRHPEMREPVVAFMHMEHLGEMEFKEVGEKILPTGVAEHSILWTRNQPILIDAAIDAVKRFGPARVQVSVPERPGIHGDQQEPWWGVGAFGQGALASIDYWGEPGWNLPGFGLGGWLGNYWSTKSGIEVWDRDLFIAQANTMTRLTGVLMTVDLEAVKSEE